MMCLTAFVAGLGPQPFPLRRRAHAGSSAAAMVTGTWPGAQAPAVACKHALLGGMHQHTQALVKGPCASQGEGDVLRGGRWWGSEGAPACMQRRGADGMLAGDTLRDAWRAITSARIVANNHLPPLLQLCTFDPARHQSRCVRV